MTFLPIVARELRVATRRKGTYWCRYASAAVAAMVCFFLLGKASVWKRSAQVGGEMFYDLSLAALVYALCAGVFATADCLSREKRNGTLGLLFLTDLKGYDVVLGKLASSSLTSLYGLIAVFPVLAIALPLGGVTFGEYGRMALALLNALLFSLSIGMVVSAVARQEKTVVVATILGVLLFVAAPVLWFLVYPQSSPFNGVIAMMLLNPYFTFQTVHPSMASSGAGAYFWLSLACIHVLSWGLLWMSCSLARTSWQDKALGARAQRWRDRWRVWCHGDRELRHTYRRRLLDAHPILWLGCRDRLQRPYVWLVLAVMMVIWFGVSMKISNAWRDAVFIILTSVTLHSFLKIWLASEAVRRFGDDLRNGSLELLLSTRLNWAEIIKGHVRSLRHQFLRPCLLVVAIDMAIMVAMASKHPSGSEYAVSWCFGMIVSAGLFLADLHLLSWTGILEGLRIPNSRRATATALFRVLTIPWLIFGVMFMMAGGQLPAMVDIALMLAIKVGYNFTAMETVRMRLEEFEFQIRQPPGEIAEECLPASGYHESPTDWTAIKSRVATQKPPPL